MSQKSKDFDLYQMAKRVREIFLEYEHIDVDFRICYALVIARTLAKEVGNEKMVKAVEEVQSLIATEIFEGFIPALERVLNDVEEKKNGK